MFHEADSDLLDVEGSSVQVVFIHGGHGLLHKLFIFKLHHTDEEEESE